MSFVPLSATQQKVLTFMRQFFADNDQLPTNACIASRFGWKSVNAASEVVLMLERKGHIERNVLGKFRFSRQPAQPTVFPQTRAAAQNPALQQGTQ